MELSLFGQEFELSMALEKHGFLFGTFVVPPYRRKKILNIWVIPFVIIQITWMVDD